jgi:hypothetical protein
MRYFHMVEVSRVTSCQTASGSNFGFEKFGPNFLTTWNPKEPVLSKVLKSCVDSGTINGWETLPKK